ncbi:hypothetical protein D3C81_936030 [compost metagenome]
MGEMLANVFLHHHAALLQFVFHQLFYQRRTAATAGARFGAGFHRRQIAATLLHRVTDIALADVMARTNLRRGRQGGNAQGFRRSPRRCG